MWEHMHDYGWGGFGMGFGMLLFWGLVIAAVAVLIKFFTGSRTFGLGEKEKPGEKEKSPLDILKERYARGEIEREEFEQKKRDLQQ